MGLINNLPDMHYSLELTIPTHEDFYHQMLLQISDSHQQM